MLGCCVCCCSEEVERHKPDFGVRKVVEHVHGQQHGCREASPHLRGHFIEVSIPGHLARRYELEPNSRFAARAGGFP